MRRTGPLIREDSTVQLIVLVPLLNTGDRDHRITLTATNIFDCPVTEIFSREILVPKGCGVRVRDFLPVGVFLWEVQIKGDEDVLATVYHIRTLDFSYIDSLTYRETQLIGHDD